MKRLMALFTILVTIAMLLPAMPVLANGGGGGGGLQAICVAWQPANQSIPHYTYSGKSITLKGIARGTCTQYKWDFGDGSPMLAWTSITNPYNLGISHTYNGSVGVGFTATLYVTDGTTTVSDTYPVTIFDASTPSNSSQMDVKVNIAIDEGLWWLHTNLNRGTFAGGAPGYGQPFGYWTEPGWGYTSAATGAAVNAFQLHGNKVNGDYDGDPYVEDVQRVMNYLLYYTNTVSIYDEGHGNPDLNGNGFGLYTSQHGTGEQTYVAGICGVALASSGAPNYKAPVGSADVYNRYIKDIVQDEVEFFAWGQVDGGWGRGGWRYSADSGDADMSTTQWPVLTMQAAKENMGSIVPAWVYTELDYFVDYCEYTAADSDNNGGYYYYPPYYLNLTKAGAGMICREFQGYTVADATIQRTLGFIYRNWNETGTSWDWTRLMGNSYGMYAIMKAMRVPEPDITQVVEYIYSGTPHQSANSFDWYYTPAGQTNTGIATYIVGNQQSDGHWDDSVGANAVSGALATGWRILCLLKGVAIIPPIAQIYPCPMVGPPTPILVPIIYKTDQAIKLTGSTSFSPAPSKNIVSYEWDLDNDGVYDDASGVTASIPAGFPALGDYNVSLRVTDDNPLALGGPQTGVGYYVIRVRPPCLDPVAVAGGPYLGSINVNVQLDGSASWDADGLNLDPFMNITKYEWDLNNDGFFGDATGAKPLYMWTAPFVGTIALKVTDDGCPGASGSNNRTNIGYASVNIGHHDPVSNPGGPYTAKPGLTINLDGSSSYSPDGVPISFSWDLNNDGTFGDATTVTVPFTLGSVIGTVYNVALKVTDSFGAYNIGHTTLTVVANQLPTANAGPDQMVYVGATVSLNGSGSTDANGDPLTYNWSLVSKPAGSATTLNNPITVNPTFVADKFGSYVVQLIVNDGEVNSAPDTVTITTANSAPVANAGPDQTVNVGATTSLNGSSSSDVDGDPLTYSWSFVSRPAGSAATLDNPIVVNPTFVVDKPGTYGVQLIVNDGKVNSAPDTITIKTANLPPTANAGPDQTVEQTSPAGANATLNGTASSDVDGDPLTYAWSWTGGSATGATPSVSLPAGTTTITLTVTDVPYGATGTDTVDITVRDTIAPAVTPPPDVTVTVSSVPTAVTIGTAGATDAVGVTSLTSNAPATFNAGDTYVIWTARDAAGNPGTATQKVTVILTGGLGQAIKMSKEAVVGSNGTTVTCTVVIENNASSGYPLTIESVYDLVYHYSAGIDNVTIVPTVEYPVFTLAAGDNTTLTFTYEKATGDEDQEVMDTIVARGYHTLPSGRHIFAGAIESASITFPVPELSAGVLFGLGALGLAGFILLRRKSAALKT